MYWVLQRTAGTVLRFVVPAKSLSWRCSNAGNTSAHKRKAAADLVSKIGVHQDWYPTIGALLELRSSSVVKPC